MIFFHLFFVYFRSLNLICNEFKLGMPKATECRKINDFIKLDSAIAYLIRYVINCGMP